MHSGVDVGVTVQRVDLLVRLLYALQNSIRTRQTCRPSVPDERKLSVRSDKTAHVLLGRRVRAPGGHLRHSHHQGVRADHHHERPNQHRVLRHMLKNLSHTYSISPNVNVRNKAPTHLRCDMRFVCTCAVPTAMPYT